MKIRLSDLEQAFELLTAHIEKEYGAEIEVDSESYLYVGSPERYQLKPLRGDPIDYLAMGYLDETYEQLTRSVIQESRPSLMGYKWLAELMQAIADIDKQPFDPLE